MLIATHLANALLTEANNEPVNFDESIMNDSIVKKYYKDWKKKAEALHKEAQSET